MVVGSQLGLRLAVEGGPAVGGPVVVPLATGGPAPCLGVVSRFSAL